MSEQGKQMMQWATDLFPICRSLSGQGVRDTLRYIHEQLPDLSIHSIASGEQLFDWSVPDEWNVKDAYVADMDGNRVIDFKAHNLHLMGYSEPVDRVMDFRELDEHLYSLPDQPTAIPYITSYYKRRWGFCVNEQQREQMRTEPDKQYHVVIDSILEPGELNYAELLIPGESDEEILLSTYVCHPSMANNELSGPCVATALAQWLQSFPKRRYSYRIVFLVETIGSIIYLGNHLDELKQKVKAGFVLSCVGDNLSYGYVASRYGDTLADKAAKHVLQYHAPDYQAYSFLQRGSDERQYCAPGVDLPVCSITRSKYGEYPEYHTSLDDLSFISEAGLQGAFDAYKKMITMLEHNHIYRTTMLCEPQLGKRGLYPSISSKDTAQQTREMMNLIAYADGSNDLIDIAELINANVLNLFPIAQKLVEAGVLEVVD